MTNNILNLSKAPHDPIERLVWLGGVRKQVERELDTEFALAYFWSRFTGRLDEAEALALHSHKRVMAFTRATNEVKGRAVRWNDQRS